MSIEVGDHWKVSQNTWRKFDVAASAAGVELRARFNVVENGEPDYLVMSAADVKRSAWELYVNRHKIGRSSYLLIRAFLYHSDEGTALYVCH